MNAGAGVAQNLAEGRELHAFASRLFPICRSITGDGVRETLRLIGERVPLVRHEVPSGTRVFDWEVPLEWNIEEAAITDPEGRRVVDFARHNLHLVSYSEPIDLVLELPQVLQRLHVLPDSPDWIPYRTSYYQRSWGFCTTARERDALRPGRYRAHVRSSLAPGSLTYGELMLPGRSRDEVLFFTHVCHPSLANDNTSGMAVATALAQWIANEPRRYSYRFVFAPGTIGSLTWLARNERRLKHIRHGLVLGLLGDPGPLTYKRSRDEDRPIDAIGACAVRGRGSTLGFSPYGYDERQLCSPGFNLPVGRLTRSVNGGYPEYHTSADNLSLITPAALAESLGACRDIVEMIEHDARYRNLSPKGEPRLGKRGLYGGVGGRPPARREEALLWVLNQSDGRHSLLDIAQRSGLAFGELRAAAGELESAGLLRRVGARAPSVKGSTARRPRGTRIGRKP